MKTPAACRMRARSRRAILEDIQSFTFVRSSDDGEYYICLDMNMEDADLSLPNLVTRFLPTNPERVKRILDPPVFARIAAYYERIRPRLEDAALHLWAMQFSGNPQFRNDERFSLYSGIDVRVNYRVIRHYLGIASIDYITLHTRQPLIARGKVYRLPQDKLVLLYRLLLQLCYDLRREVRIQDIEHRLACHFFYELCDTIICTDAEHVAPNTTKFTRPRYRRLIIPGE